MAMTQPSGAKRHIRLVIVVALAAFLVAQAAIATLAPREPFPAVVMPGFGSSAPTEGPFRATLLDIEITFDDGSTLEPTFAELMSDFRFSSARPSIDYMFHPKNNPDASDPPTAVVTWLKHETERLGDGKNATSISFCWRPTDIDLRTAEAVPGGPCISTEVAL